MLSEFEKEMLAMFPDESDGTRKGIQEVKKAGLMALEGSELNGVSRCLVAVGRSRKPNH